MGKHRGFFHIVRPAAAVLLMANMGLALPRPSEPENSGGLRPSAVAGQSWLQHLARSFDETSMGRTGRLGPPEATADDEAARARMEREHEPENKTVMVHGSDLYRMNCRGCHGENGAGAPPEINSVIGPVRATSAAAVMERMKTAGMDMSRTEAAKLAQQSRTMLLDRLHHGGQDMPAFPHLSEEEMNSLVAYLRQLAGVPGAENEQLTVREERVRIGEHIAKSTCHICHSASGPNPTAQQLYDGAIPALNTLVVRTNPAQFVRKVTQGAPIAMGAPQQPMRGRMPVFYYVSEEEAADVYLYLTSYPPYQWAIPEVANAGARPDAEAIRAEVSEQVPVVSPVGGNGPARSQAPTAGSDVQIATFPVLAGLLATLLLGLGFAFTACELRRLAVGNEGFGSREDAGAGGADVERTDRRLDAELAA